jgi:hypothetical protein
MPLETIAAHALQLEIARGPVFTQLIISPVA